MTTEEFQHLLKINREVAIEAILRNFVHGCLDDGPDEVARVLTVWATHSDRQGYPQLDLGDDEALLDHARHYGTVTDEMSEQETNLAT